MTLKTKNLKIISGGQSGVDRAALDFALQNDIPCGGWCPKGRHAEDGIIPEVYPLKETASTDHSDRTRLNIEDSDATLIIYLNEMDEGTRHTLEYTEETGKPVYVINETSKTNPAGFGNWMDNNNIHILNVAGPRESSVEGTYKFAFKVLGETLL